MTKAAPHSLSPCCSATALFDDPGEISPATAAPSATGEASDLCDASCKCGVPRTLKPHGADGPMAHGPSAPIFPMREPGEMRRRSVARLRAEIRALEGNRTQWCAGAGLRGQDGCLQSGLASSPGRARFEPWTLGEAAFDDCLPGGCLDPAGLIELKPASHGDWPAAVRFAACLAMRRQCALAAHRQAPAPLLWCATSHFLAEHGKPYGPGLSDLGLAPETLILVDVAREADVLWALEESVRSKTLSVAMGLLKGVALTPSRRLGLAASAGETPVVLLTSPSSPPALSAPLRLRLQSAPSGPHPFDARAPGATRIRLTLERCKGAPAMVEARSFDLEWCNVTYRFRMAADVVDRAFRATQSGQRA